MELRHIRYFLAVAAERNFSRAAERVGIGQPPLSLQIRDLEREVGARLFHRIPQGAELTAAGKAFHDLVCHMPDQVEDASRLARRAARGEVGALTIGYTPTCVLNPVLPAAIRSFRRGYPDVSLTLKESHTAALVDGLLKGELDAGFVRAGEATADNLVTRHISEEPLLALLPKAHPGAKHPQLNLADLRGESFILFPREDSPHAFDYFISVCREAGFEPILGPRVPQLISIAHLVAAEVGVSLLPASMRHLQVEGVVFKTIHDVAPVARLSLAWRRVDTSLFLRNFLACAVA